VTDYDQIVCGYDGVSLWYQGLDMSSDISRSEYLRVSSNKLVAPDKIRYTGLCFEEKAAYSIRYKVEEQLRKDHKEERLKEEVEFAGGRYVAYKEGADFFNVTYNVDGHEYTSTISKDSGHRVMTAGICVSGRDRDFDLKSLITVMREHQGRYNDEDY